MEQKICKILGESGCYFFCLLHYVGKENDALSIYKKVVDIGWMDPDCYVKDPCAILRYLTGKSYTVVKDTVLDPKANIIIGLWHNPATSFRHFVVMDSNNNVVWDSLGDSSTVRDGYLESYRLFRCCN